MCSAKSSVAAAAACALNPAIVMRALQNRVSPDTETVFDDAFWVRARHVLVQALLMQSCCHLGLLVLQRGGCASCWLDRLM